MEYVLLTFKNVSSEKSDILIAELSEINFNGFEESENVLKAYISKDLFDNSIIETISSFEVPFEKEIISETNWNEEWEKNFSPVMIPDYEGNKNYCYIRAYFHPTAHADHEIIITPKMSFGTGHHATTFMMVEQMSELAFDQKTVADFGTGTGILAVLAEKLGAKEVIGYDNDPWSIENSKENIKINNCKNIQIDLTETFPKGSWDIVLANINLNIIISNFDSLYEGCKEKGFIILSGMLKQDIPAISQKLKNYNLKDIRISEKDNWISVKIQK